jgi:HSP20 family protein
MMMTTLNNRVSALFADPLRNVLREIDRDFGWNTGWNSDGGGTTAQKLAPLSLWEDDNSIYIEMDVPGLTIEDLDVTMEKGKLRISGQRRNAERPSGAYHEERCFGQFERYVALSDWVDPNTIDASLQNGVLRIKFSKRPEQQRQRVNITTGDSSVKKLEST